MKKIVFYPESWSGCETALPPYESAIFGNAVGRQSLLIEVDKQYRGCRIVWKSENKIGVAFQ
jgi:hypothetical protein